MIIKLPTLKTEEGKKLRGPSMRPSERVSVLLELADALRMNGELVRKAVLLFLGPGAQPEHRTFQFWLIFTRAVIRAFI